MAIVLDGTNGVTTNSGTLISATTIGVGGATPSTSGAGITFPATQSASSDANTLDDYEEGTFTPIVVGSTTAGTGTYGVDGLPFTASSISSSSAYTALATWTNNLALSADNILQSYPDPAATTITLNQVPTGGGATGGVPLDTAFQIMLAGNYFS